MGTELLRRGAPASACLEEQNLACPERVAAIHADYRRAGAGMLTTNTFGANHYRLLRFGLESRVRELNLAGVRLARAQANGALVAGSIGPSGEMTDRPDAGSLRAAYREQAEALAAGGVDLFCCETFGDVAEARAAVLGIREVSERPIILQMTYRHDGRTPLGLTPEQVVDALGDLAPAAIGVNCAVGAGTVERVIEELRVVTVLPLVARPNAGRPIEEDGRLRYPMGPAGFAELAGRLAPAVAILGGCCGTTPEHIAAASSRLPSILIPWTSPTSS